MICSLCLFGEVGVVEATVDAGRVVTVLLREVLFAPFLDPELRRFFVVDFSIPLSGTTFGSLLWNFTDGCGKPLRSTSVRAVDDPGVTLSDMFWLLL